MNSNPVTVYGIPNCDTVKKARDWLTAHGVAYEFHDFKKQGLPLPEIDRWIEAVGFEKLLNRGGADLAQIRRSCSGQRGRWRECRGRDEAQFQRDQAAGGAMGQQADHGGV